MMCIKNNMTFVKGVTLSNHFYICISYPVMVYSFCKRVISMKGNKSPNRELDVILQTWKNQTGLCNLCS